MRHEPAPSFAALPPDAFAAELLDALEERAAIREHEGGQPRPQAEAAALAEVAAANGIAPDAIRTLWAARARFPSPHPPRRR